MSDRGKLGNFLKEVIHWNWAEFVKAEEDHNYTGFESIVMSLVRTCSDGKLGAIKLAIDRVDGKIETPIKIEYPKVYFAYPEAKSVALDTGDSVTPQLEAGTTVAIAEPPEAEEEPVEIATLTLRETLNKLADSPRMVTKLILHKKKEVESNPGAFLEGDKAPLVKSVIAANLLHLAERNNFEAITEVFDQIDGKLVETIRILGDDIYLSQYALEAPAGAVKNKEGIYVLEARTIADQWKQKLSKN